MAKFSFYFLLQVLDEIGVDVASLVGIRSYSFLDLVTIWYYYYYYYYYYFVTKLIWVILGLLAVVSSSQRKDCLEKS